MYAHLDLLLFVLLLLELEDILHLHALQQGLGGLALLVLVLAMEGWGAYFQSRGPCVDDTTWAGGSSVGAAAGSGTKHDGGHALQV